MSDDEELEAQEDAAEQAEEEAERRREAEPPPALSREDFLAWRAPREGDANPTPLDNALWHWLVFTRRTAYSANTMLDGPSSIKNGPMWCFDRFGKSETALPDGRVVHIGGEHEDFYDSNFFIYNDVTVLGPDGSISILGYPHSAFPPTDFHSATLVGTSVVIIGGLGYPAQRRVGVTPVYQLDLEGMRIAPLPSIGAAPGWMHRHTACLSDDGRGIVVSGGEVHRGAGLTMQENIDTWSYDLADGRWTRLTALDWQRWTMRRVDGKRNRLRRVREAQRRRSGGWDLDIAWTRDDPPDFDALERLYRLDADAPPPEEGAEHNWYRVVIDGVPVRFVEESYAVTALVEGRLSDVRLAALQAATLATLARLDASPWEIEAE